MRRQRPGSSSRGRSRPRHPIVAREEVRAAFETFRELGASRSRDAAAALLRELGASPGARTREAAESSRRAKTEVLGLLGSGMSNAQIATTLFISEKTVGHHVSHILAKLGVRNRAEAAAVAARAER